MTVRELIEKLQECPQDAPVMVDYEDIECIRVNDEHYFGDPHNPYCLIGTAVELE